MTRLEVKPKQQKTWAVRKKQIIAKYSFLKKEGLLLIEYNPSEFIARLQYITGLTRAEIVGQIEKI